MSVDSGDLVLCTAVDLVGLMRSRRVSVTEVMRAHLERIDRLNPYLNAIVDPQPDRALATRRGAGS
ncbi:hypothetical protein [Microlunatus sp. Gsoil 973]|uniref:hypothetical protein n=1 Tax=Microlunatus sp. Gsoil 973 TaxID=2672569 RepID=UPI001E58A901|nr:hypothetical protein [Microlunatus sp. Gsoil 973]